MYEDLALTIYFNDETYLDLPFDALETANKRNKLTGQDNVDSLELTYNDPDFPEDEYFMNIWTREDGWCSIQEPFVEHVIESCPDFKFHPEQ